MAPVAAQSAASPKQGTAWESKTIPPENAKPAPQAAAPQPLPASKGTESLNGQPWRVVIYAYTREADAANKARAVNAKHPDLQAEAFSPSGNSPYLVVVGGRLSREDANRLLHRVRGMGLPRDAYIQNYDR
jgi:cell division septation protein DedD